MNNKTFLSSLKNALNGLQHAVRTERNLQIELFAFALNLVFIVIFDLTYVEIAILLLVCAIVLCMELLNTALEKMADFIEPKWNDKIGLIKDLAAGAVLLASLFALFVGLVIYLPHLKALLLEA
ncbi:diacylglycerol kinase [Chryseobacterium sp. A301]